MGAVIDMTCNRAIVKQNERGWIALVIENCRGVEYQFERQVWAEKFARDRHAEWKEKTHASWEGGDLARFDHPQQTAHPNRN